MSATTEARDAPALVRAAKDIGPLIREHAPQAERERRLPETVVRALKERGLLRMALPEDLGGGERRLSEQLEVLEELARADGAAAWCAMITSTTGHVAAYLDDETRREVFGDPDTLACGVYAPMGRAKEREGGFEVSGRWPFGSFAEHCGWRLGGGLVARDDGPPEMRLFFFRADQTAIHDTWDVIGLEGTGSHDFEVDHAFVPARLAVTLSPEARQLHRGSYGLPVMGTLAAEVAAVALGLGFEALSELKGIAKRKKPAGSKRTMAERGLVQSQVADAEARLTAARAYLHATVRQAEERRPDSQTSDAASLSERAHLRLAACHAAQQATEVTDGLFRMAGGSAIYRRTPLQRVLRSVHVAGQHLMVGDSVKELAGRALLGLEAGTETL
jgi:alkylation response protein AidB-like acyl-CoA dehydrogenase